MVYPTALEKHNPGPGEISSKVLALQAQGLAIEPPEPTDTQKLDIVVSFANLAL